MDLPGETEVEAQRVDFVRLMTTMRTSAWSWMTIVKEMLRMMAKRVVNGKSALGTSQNEAGSDFPSQGCPVPLCLSCRICIIALDPSTSVASWWPALLGASEIVESSEFDQEVDILWVPCFAHAIYRLCYASDGNWKAFGRVA
jgi:hypothetical protein